MKKTILVLIILLFAQFSYSQKAYERYTYTSKDNFWHYKFYLASGYEDASKIQTLNPRNKKLTEFIYNTEEGTSTQWVFNYINKPGEAFNLSFVMPAIPFGDCIPVTVEATFRIESEERKILFELKH